MSISSIDQLFADALERQKQASEESNAALERRLDPSQYLMSEEEKAQNYESSLWDYPRDAGLGIAQTGASIFTSMVDAAAALGSGIVNANAEKMADVGLIDRPEKPVDFNRAMYESGWWNPKAVSDTLQDLKSPRRKAQSREIAAADGAWETGKAYLSRPYSAFMDTVESTPYMVGTGFAANVAAKAAAKEAVAKGLTDKALKSYVNKEAVNAGANMEGTLSGLGVFQDVGQHNLENGDTFASNESVLAALAAKAGTKGLSKVNPMEATLMTNRATKGLKEVIPTVSSEPKSLLRSTASFVGAPLKSITKEGLMEEGPQNVLEGVVTRAAKGEDPGEGVGSEFMQGAILGGVTGGLLHYPTHGFGSRGTVEDAVNNGSQTQQPAQRQPRQAIPLLPYDRPLGADGSGGVMVGPGSDSPSPRMRLNPEEQSQIAQATTDAQNPNAQVQQPVETQQPTMSPEEAELAQMEAEESARRQAVIDKYGLEFNREHGAAFADVTRNITDEAEKDFHAKILQAAGMMGIKNPFKEKEAAANFATEYKTFGGDLAKLAEFYRNIGIKAENDAGKKQGALRQAEFYQQLADLLEGGELLNFEQRRARKEEKKAAQAAEIQAAQVQQTAEQMMAQEPAPVEAQPEVKTQPKPEAQSEIDSTIPSEEELSTLEPDRKRNYRGKVAAIIARLESEGKISPEQKEQVYRALNNVRKGGSQLGAYKAAISKLRSIENPPPKKVKPESGLERAQKDAIKRTANSILTSAENLPASVGYTPEQRTAFKAQHAGLLSIQKSKFSASKKELEDWSEAHAVGDFEKATAIYDKYKARQMAKSYETLVKDLEEGVEGKAEFLEAVKRRDWQQAVNIAENTMDLTPRDLIKSVKSKKAIVSETAADGEYELATEDSYENEPSHQLAQREADEKDLTKVGGQVTTDAISIEPYKGEIAPDVRETAKMLYEDREGLDAALSREGDKQDQSVIPLYYALLEQAMQAKDNAMARKLASMIKRVQKKPAQLENEKPDEAPKLTKEEAKKEEAGTDLEVSNRRPTSRIPESNITQTNSINKTTADKEPVVVNATIPESPFEKKEEAPKKTKFGDALKKAFDEAKEKAKTEGEGKPEEFKGPVPKVPKDPFKGVEENKAVVSAVEGKEKDAKAAAKAEMKVRSILESMQDYLDGKRKKRLSENQVDLVNELKDKGFLFVDDEKILDDYNKRIETKFGKSTRHASKSAKTDPETSRIRGLQRLQEALENRTSAHRAMWSKPISMWSPSLNGWVDFDYGRLGSIIDENFTTKGAMGVSHIVDKRSLAQGLNPAEVALVLREMVNTVAYGEQVKAHEKAVLLKSDKFKVVLSKSGGNSYVITGFGKINKGEAVSSGTSDTVYSAQANLDAHGKSIPPILEREKNLSRIVKIIADQKLLFKGDELKARKASKSSLTEKQKKQNYNDVRNGLNKSWGVSTTKELLDSGKVVICDSNEGFIDTIVKDYLAKDPNLSEEEVRNTLHEEGLDKGTNAIYDENTGKVYINGENVDENEAGSVLAHEIGVHAAKDSEFKGLVKDIEDRVATLMAEGLKSKNPAVKKFWEDVKRRMDDADVSDNEERLAYFLEVYVKRNGVIPQSIQSEMYQAIGQLKDWLLKFLGIKSINEHKAAELLCDVVRAYADQSAMEKGSGRHASKKGKPDKSDKPKKPRKQLTPEEKEKKEKEKLAKMTPSQRASYERQQKRAELNRKIKKQQDERVGKAEMEKTEAAKNEAKAVETGGFKKLIEDTFTGKAAPIGDAILWVGEVGAKLNNKLFKFTDRLVDELSKFAPSAKGYYQKLIDHAKARAEYQAKSAAIYEGWQKLDEKNRKAVNQFLFDSTSSGLWGYIPADWTDMDGKAIPEETFGQVDAHMAKQFEALSPEAQAVVQQVFKYGHDTMILKQKLYDLMGQALQGKNYVSPFKSPKSVLPYSPLRRTGTYNVVWVSPELKEARGKLKALQDKYTSLKENDKDEEQVATRNAKLGVSYAKEAVDKLERSADHYYVGRFEYFTDARQAVRDLKAEHPGNDAVMYEIGTEEGLKSLTSTAEVNEMTANLITAVEKNYGPVSKAMKQSILEMTMDAAQKKVDASMRKRRNIAGANPNMMDSFLHQGQTDSWLLSNMQFGKQISDAFQKVKTETKDYREGPEEGKATVGDMQALYNELQARHQRMMERHNHNAWDTFSEWARTSNTALTLSFKPMFYVQNALQPWMMTAPWLAGQFGGYKTQTAMAKAYGEWGTMFNAAMKDAKTASEKFHAFGNLSKQIEDSKLPLEEKAMLKEMMSRNLLDLGAQQEFGNVTGRSAISKAINKTMVEISVAARGVELLNRYVTAVSGFRLKKAELMGKGKTESEAVQGATEYAADLLSMTQGDYSALNAPDWFNTRPGKFMLQFRKFQAIQLNFFKQMLKNSFDKNMSKEERAAARRQLTWALGTHFAMAGVKGLPAMSATLALLSFMGLLGDDDEDEETALRRHLAEAGVPVEFQDLMLEGLPSFLGWNLSDSVGAGTMLSAAPYRREDLFSKDGFREAIWNLGGAPLGRAERIWKGFFDSNWEHQRPFWEAVLPAGIPSALKAAGIFDPTEDKKTGAKMLNDDEISFGSRALMMLGATPKSVERMYKMRNQAFRTQEYIKEEKGDLTRRWIDAMKNRDYKAQSEIRKELPELNKTRRAKGFKPVSMNDLMTAWKTRQKEEKLMQKNHGLKLPNSQQGFAKQLNKIYN